MTKETASKIYDILVVVGGAYEPMRSPFIHYQIEKDYQGKEWRFGGALGFGGKYWTDTNCVSCYSEDETPKRLKLINKINRMLKDV